MIRTAHERHLMRMRLRQDLRQHWPDSCDCTLGRFRKSRALGCKAGGRDCGVCRLGNGIWREPTRQELRADSSR